MSAKSYFDVNGQNHYNYHMTVIKNDMSYIKNLQLKFIFAFQVFVMQNLDRVYLKQVLLTYTVMSALVNLLLS